MTKFFDRTVKFGAIACGALLALSINAAAADTPEEILTALGYEEITGEAPKPFGNYLNGRQVGAQAGSLVFVSSAAPQDVNGEFGDAGGFIKGRFGDDLQADEKGREAGRACLCSLVAFLARRHRRFEQGQERRKD